ncbi:MAG: peptidylprolyl isomerase, partial [Candidatus Nanohaloarchaea archaeon]|nr:peptidylprolyl isomerase [Candidatus Nanohaloarchaea archaeon]
MDDHDVIRINYVGRVKKTGEIFDLTDEAVAEDEEIDTSNMDLGPVPVLLGEGYVLEGLDERIKDMEPGDERTVEVPAEDAFGNRTSDNIKTLSKREFDEYDVTPRRGMPVEIDGRRGKILTVSNGRVKVDFNHPLAGKDLEYDVEVLERLEDPVD